jgi:5-methylcytosine-specific restriction endonuclease McrA
MHHCSVCQKNFKSNQNLQKHLRGENHIKRIVNTDQLIECHCGKTFMHKSNLSRHKKICDVPVPQEEVNDTTDRVEIERESSQNIIDAKVSQLELELTDVLSRLSQVEEKIKRQPTIIYQDSKRRKIPDHVRLDICTKQNGHCKGCDQVLGDFFQLDHIVALRFGGTNDESNLQALCGQCHNEKSALESIHQLEIQEAVSTILEKHKESRRLTMTTS